MLILFLSFVAGFNYPIIFAGTTLYPGDTLCDGTYCLNIRHNDEKCILEHGPNNATLFASVIAHEDICHSSFIQCAQQKVPCELQLLKDGLHVSGTNWKIDMKNAVSLKLRTTGGWTRYSYTDVYLTFQDDREYNHHIHLLKF